MKLVKLSVWLLLFLLGSETLSAQNDIYQGSWPASPGVRVSIDLPVGHLRVEGWERSTVSLEGRLGTSLEAPQVEADGQKVRLRLAELAPAEPSAEDESATPDLTLRVPVRSRLQVRTFSASVEVRRLEGYVNVQTVGGDIDIAGQPDEVHTRTLRGSQRLDIQSRRLTARGLEGALFLSGAVQAVDASSVSGPMQVDSQLAGEVKLLSTSGRITYSGEILPTGRLTIETTEGDVELQLSAETQALLDLSSQRGRISTPGQAVPRESEAPETSSTLPVRHVEVLGGGGPRIEVVSRSGQVRVVRPAT